MTYDFPADVKQFIAQNIQSLAQLELLLLLHSEKQRLWDVEEISKTLGFSQVMSHDLLRQLIARGFAAQIDASFRYGVTDDATDQLIAKLGDTYRARRVAVTTEIYSTASNQLKSLADAFRLRKEK